MKKYLFLFLLLLALEACVMHRHGNLESFDGLSQGYSGDAQTFAEHTADEIGRRFAPAQTTFRLHKAGNDSLFGDRLEQELRNRGFAVSNDTGLDLTYHVDVLEANSMEPTMGFVQIKCGDGSIFSFSREIFRGTAPTPEYKPLPSNISEQDITPKPSEQARIETLFVEPSDLKGTSKLTKGGTAKQVARRNHVNLEKFCSWNNIDPETKLVPGNHVFLKEPPKATPVVPQTPATATMVAESNTKPAPAPQPKVEVKHEPLPKVETPKIKTPKKEEPKPMQASAPVSSVNRNAAGRIYTVKKATTAGKLADRLGLKRKDFCEWNSVGNNAKLPAGYKVFISKPDPDQTIDQTVSAESLPAPRPVTAQTGQSGQSGRPVKETPLPPAVQPAPLPAPAASNPVQDMGNLQAVAVYDSSYKQWEVVKGSMLRTTLETWAMLAGWSIAWNASNDFEMSSSATFRGEFLQALQDLFRILQKNGLGLRIAVYTGNNVVEISDH